MKKEIENTTFHLFLSTSFSPIHLSKNGNEEEEKENQTPPLPASLFSPWPHVEQTKTTKGVCGNVTTSKLPMFCSRTRKRRFEASRDKSTQIEKGLRA
jgi:hypothetical protein